MAKSNALYKRLLVEQMERNLGVRSANLSHCIGSSSDPVLGCPVAEATNQEEPPFHDVNPHPPQSQQWPGGVYLAKSGEWSYSHTSHPLSP